MLPALFDTVHCETLIPVLLARLWRRPLHGRMDSCLSLQSGARRVWNSAAGAQVGTMASDCLGMFSPWIKMPRPAQEWCGCLGRQPFITRKQGGLAALE